MSDSTFGCRVALVWVVTRFEAHHGEIVLDIFDNQESAEHYAASFDDHDVAANSWEVRK